MTAGHHYAQMRLTECTADAAAFVADVEGDTAISARLREIGLVPGAPMRVVRRGSPLIIEVGNSRFCLRGCEAALVTVCVAAALRQAAPLASTA